MAILYQNTALLSIPSFRGLTPETSFPILLNIVSQGLVDGCLISPTFAFSLIPKPLQYIRIDEDRDSGFALLRNHRSSLALTEVMLLQHLILSAHKPSAPLGSLSGLKST